jgi:four helix bundle protein
MVGELTRRALLFGTDVPMLHTDLEVWKTAMDLAVKVYATTDELPKEERYGLAAQMRRAASSIASNIAEGEGRETRRETRRFLLIACGSLKELETQLMICRRLGYLEASEVLDALMTRTGQLLNGTIRRFREW